MIYFKKVIRKMNKYIEDKNEKKYKIFKIFIWSSVSKNVKTTKKLL